MVFGNSTVTISTSIKRAGSMVAKTSLMFLLDRMELLPKLHQQPDEVRARHYYTPALDLPRSDLCT